MSYELLYRAVVSLLLGLGTFQVLAGLVGLLFWLIAGTWQPCTPVIVMIAFATTTPVSYLIWERFGPER
jgi:hypothetical protein